ncbi:MAG: glycosyltransferase family 1 protein [Sphingobacteriales bacterium]|nr:MAG: glycosyltransferase family 1 protein [Sphingobacteriales bacterium]
MTVFFDDLIFSLQSVGGISVYWHQFLLKINQSPCNAVLIKRNDNKCLLSPELKWTKKTKKEFFLPLKLARILPLLSLLPAKSIYHSSYFRISLQPNVCNIVTLHDLAGELGMIKGWRRKLKVMLQSIALNNADGIICVSETTRKSLLQYYPNISPKKTTVIYHGCSDKFYPIAYKTDVLSKQIIFIGGRKEYKNFDTCLAVLAKLPDFTLLIIGGGDLSTQEKLNIKSKIANRYRYTSNVETAQLNQIYNQAYCLFYPTYYEGFGMPIVEAMKAGCAVISCTTQAIVEIAGNAAILIQNPKDVNAFKTAILSLQNPKLRNDLKEKGLQQAQKYNWDVHGAQTLAFYKQVYKQKFKT